MSRDTTWQEWEAVGDNRPPVYEDPGIPCRVYRASGFGNCVRSLTAWGVGIEGDQAPPETIRRAWAEGHRNEPVILNLLRTREVMSKDARGNRVDEAWQLLGEYEVENYGYGFYEDQTGDDGGSKDGGNGGLRQARVVVPMHGLTTPTEIRGALDGIAQVYATSIHSKMELRTRAVVEAKAFSRSTWDKYQRHGLEAFPYYAWQVSIQHHATGLPVLFVVGIKDDEGVVQEIVTDLITTPPLGLGALKARAVKLNRLIDTGSVDFSCDYQMYPCPHLFLHDDDERAVKVRVESEGIPDVGSLQLIGKKFAEARAAKKAFEDQHAKSLKEGEKIIKDWLLDNPDMEGKEVMVPVGDGEFVKLVCEVGGLKVVKHEAEPERVISAQEAWTETIVHPAVEEEVIPAKEEWEETTGTRRVTIRTELVTEADIDKNKDK